jgi:DNA-directed RNA polymerase subunit F
MEKTKNKGHDNLIPLNRKTKEEQRRIASQGGKASGEARRAKRNVKECLKMYSELLVTSPEIKSALKKSGVADAEEMTYSMAMALQFMTSAMRGNSQMARLVMELMGEVKQAQTNVNVTTNVNPYANLTEDELRKLAKGE